MARRRGGPRRLVVDGDTFLWSVSHAHGRENDARGLPRYADCRETVAVRREGSPGRLEVVFRAGPDRLVPDGSGTVCRVSGGETVNLHRPGVVRALLDEAIARGWRPGAAGRSEIDGWTLFEAVLAAGPHPHR